MHHKEVRTGGLWSQNRTTSAHRLSGTTGTTCRGFCSEMFHKEPDLFACSSQNGQYSCHCILKQTRRDSLLSTVQFSCRALELGTQQGHDSQCRTFAREVKYPSRSGVETLSGLQRLAFRILSIPCFYENSRTFSNRSICQSAEYSAPNLFKLETRSTGVSLRCLSTGMEYKEELCLSSILSDHENSCQVTRGRWQPYTDYSGLANTILVPSATRHVDSPTSASSSGSQAFDQPSGGPPPASSEQNPVSSRMACIQQSVSTRGISDNSAWSKWYSWCEKGKLIHFPPT